jgi:hypothetical protein
MELTEHYTAAAELVALLRRSHSRWLAPASRGSSWVFRGESDAAFDLEPTAWRKSALSHPVRKRIEAELVEERMYRWRIGQVNFPGQAEQQPFLRDVIAQRLFEHSVVWEFIQGVDHLGLPIPGGTSTFPKWSYDLMEDQWLYQEKPRFHPAIALARHHGIPARILDWTRNPLIAAFFAADLDQADEPGEIAIWAYNTASICPSGLPRILVHAVDRFDVGFLHAQEALFLYISEANQHYLASGQWPQFKTCAVEGSLIQLTLPKTAIRELRRLLVAEGVNLPRLCPTHDNVVRSLNEDWNGH